MIGLNQVLKMGWDIVQNDSSTAANRLQGVSPYQRLVQVRHGPND
jgi:hypothetical protein